MANISLEALTFQGVRLLLPPNENQWYSFMITVDDLIKLYCPILMSVDQAREVFKRFDVTNNNVLDYIELQKLNAHIWKLFPRLGDSAAKSKHSVRDYANMMGNVYRCVSLTYLDLSFQAIKKIPSAVKSLVNLKVLKLRYCVFLETLSSSLGALKLDELDLVGCVSLKTPPLEIQRRGVGSVLAFLNRLKSGSVGYKRTKLMLQGLGGAGKTSLAQALMHKIYQGGAGGPPSVTDGIAISDWKVGWFQRRLGLIVA